MEFILANIDPSRTFIDVNMLVLKRSTPKALLALAWRFLIGILLLAIGLIDDKEGGLNLYNSFEKDAHTTNVNFHFAASIGIAMVLLVIATLAGYLRKRNNYKTQVSLRAKRLEKYAGKAEMIINEEGVTTSNDLVRSEIKWRLFSNYMLYEKFLFLNESQEINSGIAVDCRKMDDKVLTELLTFIRQRLPEEKA